MPLSKNYIHNILLFKNIIHNHPQYHPHFCRSILSKEVFFNSTLFTMLSLGTSSFTLFTQLSVIVPLYPLPSILIYLQFYSIHNNFSLPVILSLYLQFSVNISSLTVSTKLSLIEPNPQFSVNISSSTVYKKLSLSILYPQLPLYLQFYNIHSSFSNCILLLTMLSVDISNSTVSTKLSPFVTIYLQFYSIHKAFNNCTLFRTLSLC